MTTIGKNAFSGCIRLSEVQIPKTVKTIGTAAFMDCNTLRQIDIPNSVKNVMPFAFHKCPQLGQVHTHWKDPDEAELSLAFYLPNRPGESWPENLTYMFLTRIKTNLQLHGKMEGKGRNLHGLF